MNNQKHIRHFRTLLLSLLALVIAGCVLFALFFQAIDDWYRLATYTPPKAIASLASQDHFTAYAKKLFYINRPILLTKQQFAIYCPNGDSNSYVLGCYHSGDKGIFLLSVNDPALSGLDAVTAAYEMLHAGYARLSNSDRQSVDKQMWAYFSSSHPSSAIKAQMASYEKTEPGGVSDELYSVLATEFASLPKPIANLYTIYFTNRSVITTAYNHYQNAFNSRQQAVAKDDSELKSMKQAINNEENQIDALKLAIDGDQQQLNDYLSSGNINLYDQQVGAYNSLVDQYNSLVSKVTTTISNYNALVNSRNAIALQERQLVSEINSPPQPIKK